MCTLLTWGAALLRSGHLLGAGAVIMDPARGYLRPDGSLEIEVTLEKMRCLDL